MEENDRILSPLKAIKLNCLDCMGGSREEVKQCPIEGCPLYPYRFGKNPYVKRVKREYTDEEKARLAERLAVARQSREKSGGRRQEESL